MILDIEQTRSAIKISYFDSAGNVQLRTFDIGEGQFPNWKICSDKDKNKSEYKKNWDGKSVKLVKGDRFNKFSIYEFIENLPEDIKKEITANNIPKLYSLDIETEIIDAFPNPQVARERVNSISVCTHNSTTGDFQILSLGWKDLTIEQKTTISDKINSHFAGMTKHKFTGKFEFKYVKFDDEYNMLYTLFHKLFPKFALTVGWNYFNFDWQYLFNRAKKLGIDPVVVSPSKKLQYDENIPMHIGMMDYMEIYKRWDRTVAIKENNSLDFVSGAVLGVKKIKYDGNLQELFEKDYETYIFYNAVDAALVSMIHDKLKTLNAILSVAALCNLNIYKASSAVNLTEALLWKKFYTENNAVIADERPANVVRGAYEGAYVKNPKPALYKAVSCYDFASLYPSVMRQFNVSPESFVMKLDKLEGEKYEEFKNDPSKIIAVNGAVYNGEMSILNKILTELYAKRRFHKDRHLNIQIKLKEYEKMLKDWKN